MCGSLIKYEATQESPSKQRGFDRISAGRSKVNVASIFGRGAIRRMGSKKIDYDALERSFQNKTNCLTGNRGLKLENLRPATSYVRVGFLNRW